MMKNSLLALFFFSAACYVHAPELQAQDNDFQAANRLMQQENFEAALPILRRLHADQPDVTIFLDRLLDCLVRLNKFNEAIVMIDSRIHADFYSNQLLIRKGEILHRQGDREAALETWNRVITENPESIQFYYQIGNILVNRREYHHATELYASARDYFDDSALFMNEIANAHMQSGDFPAALNEYFRLIRENPNQASLVQQRLVRMQDSELYETAALEIEDYILNMNTGHPAYNSLHQMYLWLLVETRQFRRALIAARQYESSTQVLNYSLYSLAEQLLSNNQHQLASEAFSYYTESADRTARLRSKDRKSETYLLWADYLSEYNLENPERRAELYRNSYRIGEELAEETPFYDRRDGVIIRLAETALDIFRDREMSLKWITLLEEEGSRQSRAELYYLQGRLHLFDSRYLEARQVLARAGRESDDLEISEKSRYFLSLTDFFSGDFEFALIQLRSLERRHVSYYANDALTLRVWIQEGHQSDSTETTLREYAEFIEQLHRGNTLQALEYIEPIISDPNNPLADNALVYLSNYTDSHTISYIYPLLQQYNITARHSPLRERLLWEQAVLAKFLLETEENHSRSIMESPETLTNLYAETLESAIWPTSFSDLEQLYETILMEYPQGFYAPYSRDELQKNRPDSSL